MSSARPAAGSRRRLVRVMVAAYFLLAAGFLAVRYVVLPNADLFRDRIAASVSASLGLPVSIGRVDAEWHGLAPSLRLSAVTIQDRSGRSALAFSRVDAVLSWRSVARGYPVFRRLAIIEPELDVRRESDGRLLVAGLALAGDRESGGFGDWLADQPEIRVQDATLVWSDALRPVPPLVLSAVNFRLLNDGQVHRFGLTASPPAAYASGLEVRGALGGLGTGDLRALTGDLFVRLERADLAIWRNWVDYPVPLEGVGGANAWLKLEGPGHYSSRADLALRNARTQLRADLPELQLDRLEGTIIAARDGRALQVQLSDLKVEGMGLQAPVLNARVEYRPQQAGAEGGGRVEADRLDIGVLARLAAHLPFDPVALAQLEKHSPGGEVQALAYAWEGPEDQPRSWTLAGQVDRLSILPVDGWPGIVGLSGEFSGNEREGRFSATAAPMTMDLPQIFDEARIPLDRFDLSGRWLHQDGGLAIALDAVAFENADAAGTASGTYWPETGGLGRIALQADLARADATAVWRYLPKVVGDTTRDWLRTALTAGRGSRARLELEGRLEDFPFARKGSGTFLVTADVAGATLAFAPGWPAIEGIDGQLRFEGKRMRIDASRGRVGEATIGRTTAEIADLGNRDELLRIRGIASGPSGAFLGYVSASPVSGWIGHATDDFRAVGDGALSLALELPLRRLSESTVQGEYRFADNRVVLFPGLPALERAAARVGFTERGITIADASARLMGQAVAAVGGSEADGRLLIHAAGTATPAALARETGLPLLDRLDGLAGWRARIEVHDRQASVRVDSDLSGVASALPAPLAKVRAASLPSSLVIEFSEGGRRQQWSADIGADKQARFEATVPQGGSWGIRRGGVAVNAPLRRADSGLMAAIESPELDVDAWRAVEPSGGGGGLLAGIALKAGQLRLFGKDFDDVELRGIADAGGWRGRLDSPAVAGEFDWRSRDQGTLKARFERLAIGKREASEAARPDEAPVKPLDGLPALDVQAKHFELRGMNLGELALSARNVGGEWLLDALVLRQAHGVVEAEGRWQPGGNTELAFDVKVSDVGEYLAAIGYPEAVRQGRATLEGKLGWHGPPTEIDYPSLGGGLQLQASEGQFSKLEPGVGRLLGVLSLQALPRRVTLDFRDVFSDGFAFDTIAGGIDVSGGVMRTDSLDIRGPAARVRLSGTVDLAAESQALRVAVQPTLTESVAVGAALANSATGLINPVAGLVTYLAQKLMQDPIEKLFSYQYSVTGGWSDPQVVKLAADAPRSP